MAELTKKQIKLKRKLKLESTSMRQNQFLEKKKAQGLKIYRCFIPSDKKLEAEAKMRIAAVLADYTPPEDDLDE